MSVRFRNLVSGAALLLGLLLLLRVGFAFLLEPVSYSRDVGYDLDTAAAITNARVSLGGFHLGLAAITAYGLFFIRARGAVLVGLLLFMLIVVATRIFGILTDGFDAREWLAITGESTNVTALLIANVVYFFRRAPASTPM